MRAATSLDYIHSHLLPFNLQLPSNQSYEGDRESSVDVRPCAQPHPVASHVRRAPPS